MENNLNWWEQPLPLEENKEEAIIAEPYNPNDSSNEQMTGIQKFMNIALVPHEQVAHEIIQLINNGHVNPIQMYTALKRVQQIFELTLGSEKGDKDLRELMLNKVKESLDGGKSYTAFGADFSVRATGVRYDYSECNDTILNSLIEIETEVKRLIKLRQGIIKANCPADSNKLGIQTATLIQSGMPSLQFDDNEWEDVIVAPIKYAGESVICSFKKEK